MFHENTKNFVTFTAFCVHQAIPSRTQTLVADLQVFTNMSAAAVVVQTLIGSCRENKKRLSIFFFHTVTNILKLQTLSLNT